jgi:DNA-binding CsgD family transcriptional regulator
MTTNNTSDPERSAVQSLQEINSGVLDANTLDKSSRQRCIELLIAEGYGYQHISQVLKISEKTVGRDMKEIRTRNELTPNIEFAKETIGDLFRQGLNHHAYLMRLARSKDARNLEKIQAEFAAWRVLRELVERMQSLGYLPSRPQRVVGDIFCHMQNEEGGESLEDIRKMISEIETVARDTNTYTPELAEDIKAIGLRIEKAEIVSEVKKVVEKQKEAQTKEDKDE